MIRINDRLQRMRDEEGFTLIELMVVVLIIAILIAIAIPTFLGARKRAQDRAAQSSLRNAVTSAKAIFTDAEDYSSATQAALASAEPALTFNGASASNDQTEVSHSSSCLTAANATCTGKHNRFVAAGKSDSDTCWFVQDIVGPSGITNPGTTWEKVSPAGTCNAAAAPAHTSTDWKKKPGDTT